MKIYLSIFLFAILSTSNAQVWIQKIGQPNTKLEWDAIYTKENIIQKYGQPKSINSFYDDEIHNATITRYDCDSLSLEMVDDKLNQFSFGSKQMELRIESWNMAIKIGDPISNYKNLSADKACLIRTASDHITIYPVVNGFEITTHLILYFDKDNKIKGVEWFVPV